MCVAVEIDDLVPLETGVQLRELAERAGRRLQRERDEQVHVGVGEVALLGERDGGNLLRLRQVLDDLPPHPAQALAAALCAAEACVVPTESPPGADVLLGDAAVRA